MKTVGIVGTGTMGCAVAEIFIQHGMAVYGYDAFPACIERGNRLGIKMCENLGALGKETQTIILFLPGPNEIRDCVTRDDGLLASLPTGSILIDMSTSAPENTEMMAAAADLKGITYLDAPVLGRPASIGKWALPVGGDQKGLDAVKPLLSLVAAHVIHVGKSGSGHRVKLLNQLMFGAINSMTAEMMALANQMEIAPAKLYEIITASQAGTVSNLFKDLGARIRDEHYSEPTFTMALLAKDIRLGMEMANTAGKPLLLGRSIDFLNRISCAQGYGDHDTSVLWRVVENFWKSDAPKA